MKNIFVLAFLGIVLIGVSHAYGDGFTQEVMPPASVGNKKVTLFVKINPPVITSASNQDRYLYFRWFDANNNQTIQHTTFLLVVAKHDKPLMQAILHSHTGILTLKINPSNDPKSWAINGTEAPFLDGVMYIPYDGKPLDVTAPILGDGGLYHIYTLLATIDSDSNIFTPHDAPRFDSYLSVGDVSNHTISYNGKQYNMTLVSYYDKASNFGFDTSKVTASWSMPFDWNLTRASGNPIFVHEEIRIPKTFSEFVNNPTFGATVNGVAIPQKELVADPYSNDNYMTLHILLNRDDLASLAKDSINDTMNFAVSARNEKVKTSNAILTDFGGWGANLWWSPNNLEPGAQSSLRVSFFDALSGKNVLGDVTYDLAILDSGDTIISKTGIVARNGTDIQQITLPTNGIYSVQVNVRSISTNGFVDTSRVGVGRGDLVIPSTVNTETVPEFGYLAGLVMIFGMLVTVVIYRQFVKLSY